MKRFSDFSQEKGVLEGDKVKIDSVLNQEITIIGYSIKKSRYDKNNSGKYLTLQYEDEMDKKIIFTGSEVLIEQLEKYGDEIPFKTTIKKIDRYYTLT